MAYLLISSDCFMFLHLKIAISLADQDDICYSFSLLMIIHDGHFFDRKSSWKPLFSDCRSESCVPFLFVKYEIKRYVNWLLAEMILRRVRHEQRIFLVDVRRLIWRSWNSNWNSSMRCAHVVKVERIGVESAVRMTGTGNDFIFIGHSSRQQNSCGK